MLTRRTAGAAVVWTAIAAAACNGGQNAAPPAPPPTPVELATAASTPIEDATEYVATLKSLRSTTVQPQIDGQITQILVKSGDRVRQGTPLMQIDPRRQEAAVSSQEADRAAREAAVAFARQQAERAHGLFAAGAISKQEQERADTDLQTAEANLKALQAQVRQQQVQLRYFTIAAPTQGVVGDVPVRVGNVVTPQTILTTIDENDVLELNVSVPIERAPELRNGLAIRLLNSDGTETLGTTAINFISPRADDQTQSILVKGRVANADGRLRAMQYVRARIVWRTVNGLVIPVTAVLRVSGQFFAFVAENQGGSAGGGGGEHLVARQRAIKVGPITGDNYQVLDGIKAGERVVVSGTMKLADGAPIQAAPRASAPDAQPSGTK